MHNSFTVGEALSFGWAKFKDNAWFYVALTLAFAIVSGILDSAYEQGRLDVFASLASLFVSFFSMFAFVRIGLMAVAGKKPAWKDVFDVDWKTFGLYVVASLLFAVAYLVGLALLVVPGIIAIVRFGFYGFSLVEGKLGPVQALKKSAEITKGNFWKLLGFTFVLALLNLLGMAALFVGLLVTAPVCLLATAYVYNKLKPAPEAAPAASIEAAKA